MCGRARLITDYSEIRIKLKLDDLGAAPNFDASGNICPTDPMIVAIRSTDGRRVPEKMKWGLVPWWANDAKTAFKTINARAETIDTTPAFRDAWKRGQRCLVVTDGFYEWKKDGKTKIPYAIGMADDSMMIMAGLWDEWHDKASGQVMRSCTVITCEPNGVVGALHDRMPVILDEADWPAWLGEVPTNLKEIKGLLRPCPDDRIKAWRVGPRVGNVRDKGRGVADPIAETLV